jgi:murein L,D-transpeptidase YcbB/YkuD
VKCADSGEWKVNFVMRVSCLVAVGLLLTCGSISNVYAANPDESSESSPTYSGTETAMRPEPAPVGTAPANTAADSAPSSSSDAANGSTAAPHVVAVDRLVYVPVGRYLEANKKKLFSKVDDADREALQQFYGSRMGATLWVDKNGYTPDAQNLIAALKDADNWGLRSQDYKIPDLKPSASDDYSLDDLTDAETRLSLDALAYARDARGGRIINPPEQLSGYLDRKPQLIDPRTVIETLASAPDKGAYLKSLQPQNKQFELLRQKLLALRSGGSGETINIPNGPNLGPGKSSPQIALIRKALKVPAPAVQADGKPADETYYDDGLARAVEAYKAKKGIEPVTPTITATLRRSLNGGDGISEAKLLANMEEWRWMPEDLGKFYVAVNIPDFKVRVVKDGNTVFEERIVTGSVNRQTPIFSDLMRTIVFQPRWNVPDSIKIKELLPGLRAGGDPLRRQGLVMERNGRRVKAWDINWYQTDIRNFNVYQPPGGGNALGVVKFLFPNSHAVYLHDTPSKGLFNESVRAFSHGCMRVRNPVQLAEIILDQDKGWDKSMVDSLAAKGPEENEISLDHPIPVHITYFTASVGDDGEVQSFGDIYGHEKRITLALQGKWNQIDRTKEPKVTPDDIGYDEDADSRRRGDDDDWFGVSDNDDRRRGRKRYDGGLNHFFQKVLGGL